MEMKGGEVILPLDEQLCLLLYTFSPSPVSAILEILIVLCSLAATASLLILLFTPICPWLKVGRQSLWRWGEPTSEKILRTWSVAVAVFLKKTSPHIRTTGEGEASEERSERMKVLARDVWTTSWLWRTQSHQEGTSLYACPTAPWPTWLWPQWEESTHFSVRLGTRERKAPETCRLQAFLPC